MSNKLAIIAKKSGLDKTQSQTLLDHFSELFESAQGWEAKAKKIVVTDESQTDLMKEARVARLALKEVRVQAENARKELKEKSLREGRAIDGIANVIKALIVPLEQHLAQQEQFAERLKAKDLAGR